MSRVYGTPYKLNFMVTAACNSCCSTCNIWKEFQKNPKMIKDELTLEEINKIFKRLPKSITWLSLTGGEVFLRNDIYQIIDAAIRYIPNLKLISIPCNGLAQDKILRVIHRLSKRTHPDISITFSIDGPEDLHDKIRGVKGGFKRTWDTYMKAKKIVREDYAFQIAIETTISSMNVNFLYPFFKSLLSRNHKISITIAHDAFLYKNENDKSISPAANVAEINKIVGLFKNNLSLFNPQSFIERQYLSMIYKFLAHPKKQVVTCEAMTSSCALTTEGGVYPCLMWGKNLANLRDHNYDLRKLWDSKEFRKARRAVRKNQCPNCWTPCEAYQSILWATLKFKLFPK